MKGIFKKALALSLIISMSAPMLAGDKQGFFSNLFGKKEVVAQPGRLASFKPSWASYSDNTLVNYTVKPAINLFGWLYRNTTDNRVVNPVVAAAKNNPKTAIAISVAAVTGLAYGAYKYRNRTKKSVSAVVATPVATPVAKAEAKTWKQLLPSFLGGSANSPKLPAVVEAPKVDAAQAAATLAAEKAKARVAAFNGLKSAAQSNNATEFARLRTEAEALGLSGLGNNMVSIAQPDVLLEHFIR